MKFIKKILLIILVFLFLTGTSFSQTVDKNTSNKPVIPTLDITPNVENNADEKKLAENEEDEDTEEDEISEKEKRKETLLYGMESDVTDLLSTLISEKDKTFSDDIFQLFNETRNISVKEKIILYFKEFKDDRLKDFCLEVLADPYDEKKSFVEAIFQYVSELEIKEASPLILQILESDNEDFFDAALLAIGKIGGEPEARFLVECLEDDDITLARRQNLMRALGQLKVIEIYDDLVKIAEDEDENTFVRIYALEAAAGMGKEDIIPLLMNMFTNQTPSIRVAVLNGAENFVDTNEDAVGLILDGLKDNHGTVRTKAVEIIEEHKIKKALPSLLYRAKNDTESNIKYKCYFAIASLESTESVKFLNSVIKDKKKSETARAKAVEAAFKYNLTGCYDTIKDTAEITLKDDKLKNLRYAIGKAIAKYELPQFEGICLKYLQHKDVATQGTGLDIFAKNKYPGLFDEVKALSENKKAGINQKKAKSVLEKIN